MIQLTRLNRQPFYINADLVKFIEQAPDTVLTLLSGEKLMVLEPPELIIDRVVAYRRRVLAGLEHLSAAAGQPETSRLVDYARPPAGDADDEEERG